MRLGDQSGSGSGLVLEGRRNLLGLDVVSGKSVDSGLDKNHSAGGQVGTSTSERVVHAQLGILVTSVSLEVLSDLNGLFEVVGKVLGDGGAET